MITKQMDYFYQTQTPEKSIDCLWRTLVDQVSLYITKKNGKILETQSNYANFIYSFTVRNQLSKDVKIKVKKTQESCALLMGMNLSLSKIKVSRDKINNSINKANINTKLLSSKFIFQENSSSLNIFMKLKENVGNMDKLKLKEIVDEQLIKSQKQLTDLFAKIVWHQQQNPRKILKELRGRISQLQLIIEQDIRTNEKNTLPQESLFNLNLKTLNLGVTSKTPETCSFNFEELQNLYNDEIEKDSPSSNAKILQTIKIIDKKIDSDWEAPDSSFGTITKYILHYRLLSQSINQATNKLLELSRGQKQQNQHDILGEIVEKNIKDCSDIHSKQSHKTELALIKYLRDKQQNTIASYFKELQSSDRLYTQYYPKRFSDHNFRSTQSFSMIEQLAKAIRFFQKSKIIHRDLKPDNIMLSPKMIPKIIDFGSGYILNNSIYCQEVSPILKTSRHYNLTYNSLQVKRIDPDQFEKHKNFDIYAYAIICNEILLRTKKQSYSASTLKNFDFLYRMATKENPDDRLNGRHIRLYTHLLKKDFELYKKVFP